MSVVTAMNVVLVTVSPDDSVQAAISRMVEANVGAVAVCEGPRLVGMFSERDVLRLASEGTDFERTIIGDVMTTSLVTVAPGDSVLDAARLMGERRIRHLPVLEGENLLGMIGIREVLRALVERLWSEHDPVAHDTAHELLTRAPAAIVDP
jgi:CBS domain-containing protein